MWGKNKHHPPQASVPFWKGRNSLRPSAIKTQQPEVPLAVETLGRANRRMAQGWPTPCQTKVLFTPCAARGAWRSPVAPHPFLLLGACSAIAGPATPPAVGWQGRAQATTWLPGWSAICCITTTVAYGNVMRVCRFSHSIWNKSSYTWGILIMCYG